MPKALTNITERPKVYIRDGELVVNSYDVAAHFQVSHRTIVTAVERRIHDAQESGSECLALYRKTSIGRQMPKGGIAYSDGYEMSETGFVMVAMGLTTKVARSLQLGYITEFNRMRDELRRQSAAPVVDLNDPAFLRQALLSYTEKALALEATIVEQRQVLAVAAPKAVSWEAFKDAEGLYSLSDVGRILGTGPTKTIGWMLDQGFLFRIGRGSPLRPMERYRRKGWFETKTRTVDGAERLQTFVTPRGLAEISELMRRPLDLFGKVDMSRPPQLRIAH